MNTNRKWRRFWAPISFVHCLILRSCYCHLNVNGQRPCPCLALPRNRNLSSKEVGSEGKGKIVIRAYQADCVIGKRVKRHTRLFPLSSTPQGMGVYCTWPLRVPDFLDLSLSLLLFFYHHRHHEAILFHGSWLI